MRRFVRYPTDAFPLVFLPLLFSPPPPRFWPCYYKYFYFLSDKKQCNEPALKRTPLNSKYPEKHKLCHRFLPFLEFFVLSIHIIWKWHGSFGIALYILVILRFSEQRLLCIVSPLSKYLNFHISVFYNLSLRGAATGACSMVFHRAVHHDFFWSGHQLLFNMSSTTCDFIIIPKIKFNFKCHCFETKRKTPELKMKQMHKWQNLQFL